MPVLLKEVLQIVAIFIFPVIWSIYHYRKTKRNPTEANRYFFESIPQIFPTVGILCTFFGIAYGLWKFDISDAEKSLPELMNGLKTAFFASIGGVLLLIISSRFIEYRQWKNEKGKLSDETIALNKIIQLITELRADIKNNAKELNDIFNYTDENNNKVKPGNVYRDIYEESVQQTKALKSFSTDLAGTISGSFDKLREQQDSLNTIPYLEKLRKEIENLANKQDNLVTEFKTSMSAGFEKVVGQQNELNTIPHLEKLTHEIEVFGSKQKDSSTEMTQNVVKDLEAAMERMVQEFKTSVSGSAKSELETLAKLLGQAGSSLIEFPKKMEEMTNNLNENFKGLQTIVQQISQQTLSQSTESTGAMKKQLDDISTVFKENIGTLQSGQSQLINKQSENVKLSEGLLKAFNTSIEKMNGLSNGVNETISKFSKVQSEMNAAAGQLKMISENVSNSTNSFKDAQSRFSQHSNQFLDTNSKTIEEIQKSLTRAKEVSTDYSQKFIIIENGLKGIFEQIQTGLHEYRNTIGGSLAKFLGEYTDNLTKVTDGLKQANTNQEIILEELSEQLSKFVNKTK